MVPIISLTFPGSQVAVKSAAAAAFCESAAPFKPGTVELELKSWEEGGRKSFPLPYPRLYCHTIWSQKGRMGLNKYKV